MIKVSVLTNLAIFRFGNIPNLNVISRSLYFNSTHNLEREY